MQSAWHNCSCCFRVTIFTSGKAKTCTCNRPDTTAAAASALQFLRAEKRKQVPATGLTNLHPQLLPPRYDFYELKSENRFLQPAWHTCSCCLRATIFTSGKAKTGTYDRRDTPAAAASALQFLQAEKQNRYLRTAWPAAAPDLQLLRVEKRKQVPATGLTHLHLQLLPTRYDFYERKSDNRYLRPAWHTCSCCLRATIFTSGKAKTGTSDRRDTTAAAASALRFLRAEKQKQVPATRLTNLYLQLLPPRYDFYERKSEDRYLRPAWHTCSCCPHVTIFMSGKAKTGTCDYLRPPGQVPVAGTRRASYFGWENRYLRPARPQVHVALHILVG